MVHNKAYNHEVWLADVDNWFFCRAALATNDANKWAIMSDSNLGNQSLNWLHSVETTKVRGKVKAFLTLRNSARLLVDLGKTLHWAPMAPMPTPSGRLGTTIASCTLGSWVSIATAAFWSMPALIDLWYTKPARHVHSFSKEWE